MCEAPLGCSIPYLFALETKVSAKVINHLPPCRSKPVKASFVFRTQFKIFWMKTGSPIDCQVINTVKAQKSMKDIVRIVHLPSVVQP